MLLISPMNHQRRTRNTPALIRLLFPSVCFFFTASFPLQAQEKAPSAPEIVKRVESILSNPAENGIVITLIVFGSQAYRQGFQLGDTLLTYNWKKPKSVAHLIELVGKVGEQEEVKVQLLSEGKPRMVSLKPGRIGIDGIPVKKGQPSSSRPDVADYKPDFSTLDALKEAWFAFVQEGKRIGYERHLLKERDGVFWLNAQSIFSTDGETVNMKIDIQVRRESGLPFQKVGYLWGNGDFKIQLVNDGKTISGAIDDYKLQFAAPADVLPTYCSGLLATTLPLEVGAGTRLTLLGEGNATLYYGSALVCRGQKEAEVLGKKVRAWQFEQSSFGKIGNIYWLDDDRKLVKAIFNQGEIHRTTKADALKNLPNGVLEVEDKAREK